MTERSDAIDALRGIAILLVMAVHTALHVGSAKGSLASVAQFGQLGVQLFFVVSAMTLCMSFERRTNEPMPVATFYIRRIFRIAPLYYFAIPLYAGLASVAAWTRGEALSLQPQYAVGNVLANVVFVHDLVPGATNTIVPGGWSIGAEMLFYAAFPWLFALMRKPLTGWAMLMAAIAVNIPVQQAVEWPVANNSYGFFLICNQLPVFLLGMIYAFARERRAGAAPRYVGGAAIAFAAAILVLVAIWSCGAAWSFALVPTAAGVAFVLLADMFMSGRAVPWLLVRIGQLSYSIYILHFVLASKVLLVALRLLPFERGEWLSFAFGYPLVVGGAFALATVTETWIERPGIEAGRKVIDWLRAHSGAMSWRAS